MACFCGFGCQVCLQDTNASKIQKKKKVSVGFRYSKRYPATAPELKITPKKGLSEKDVKELTKTVRTKATTLLEQEMIYELTLFVQDYLTSHNREQVSFFEAMTTRQEKVSCDSLIHSILSYAHCGLSSLGKGSFKAELGNPEEGQGG